MPDKNIVGGAVNLTDGGRLQEGDQVHVVRSGNSRAGTVGAGAGLKHNLAATTNPAATDDGPDGGYAVGSHWINVTLDRAFLCIDATNNAAIWREVGVEDMEVECSDETTALTAGTGKKTFVMPPSAVKLLGAWAFLKTPQASGNIFTVDINVAGSTILSTKLTIDNTEQHSDDATTPAVLSTTDVAARAVMTVDIDQIGNGSAKGLVVGFRLYRVP